MSIKMSIRLLKVVHKVLMMKTINAFIITSKTLAADCQTVNQETVPHFLHGKLTCY